MTSVLGDEVEVMKARGRKEEEVRGDEGVEKGARRRADLTGIR